jgi:hypothetical protein
MTIIKDLLGNDFEYWPLTGLIEGDDSEPVGFTVTVPYDGELKASTEPKVIVWARVVTAGPSFTNISTTGIDLSGYLAGELEFESYVEAVGPITGLERVYVNVGAFSPKPADWLG